MLMHAVRFNSRTPVEPGIASIAHVCNSVQVSDFEALGQKYLVLIIFYSAAKCPD